MSGGTTRRRRRVGAAGVAFVTLALGLLVPVQAGPGGELLPPTYPNLVPEVKNVKIARPILGFDSETFTTVYGPLSLHFDTWSQNLGDAPLDLLVDDPSDLARTTVSQCVAWVTDFACVERKQVGDIVWHDEHTHFHYEDFARYELRRVRPNGRVDYTRRGLLSMNGKVSFCLMDTARVRDGAFPLQRYTSSCTPAQQGISPGWADVYFSGLPGQRLPVEGLSDGRYALVITLNPTGGLYESTSADNRLEAIVELSNGLTEATIVERRWP